MPLLEFDASKTKVFAQQNIKKYDIIHTERGVFADYSEMSDFACLVSICEDYGIDADFLRNKWYMTLEAELSVDEKKFYPQTIHSLVAIIKMYVHNRTGFFGSGSDGYALLPVLGKIDHSCNANCTLTFDSEKAILIADREICTDDEITIPYILGIHNLPFKARQSALTDMKSHGVLGFVCVCQRCITESKCELTFGPIHSARLPAIFVRYQALVTCNQLERSPLSSNIIEMICECYWARKTFLNLFTPANAKIVLENMVSILMRLIIYSPCLDKSLRHRCLRLLQHAVLGEKVLGSDSRSRISLIVTVLMCLNVHRPSPDLLDFSVETLRRSPLVHWVLELLQKYWILVFVLIENERQPHLNPLGPAIGHVFQLSFTVDAEEQKRLDKIKEEMEQKQNETAHFFEDFDFEEIAKVMKASKELDAEKMASMVLKKLKDITSKKKKH